MLSTLKNFFKRKFSGRSSKWRSVRDAHIKSHPFCAVCGGTKKLNVHHIQPFHLNPDLELDPHNLISLCESKRHGLNCHLLIGHLGNFRRINSESVTDSAIWNEKLRIKDGESI